MNNLYHKVAVTSVGIALGFALGVNKEVKAATITLTPVTSFSVTGQNRDGLGDSYYSGAPFHVGLSRNYAGQLQEDRAFYEFNIANLFSASTVISSAIFQVRVDSFYGGYRYYVMSLLGYVGNGQPDASDFSQGIGVNFYNPVGYQSVSKSNFDLDFSVTWFVNELISKNDAFAGFKFTANEYGTITLNHRDARLIITTVDVPEPVPEPTTIFGSALALGVGGWLKQKKSNPHSKTTSQH